MKLRLVVKSAIVVALFMGAMTALAAETPIPVTVANFIRAETDRYFDRSVKDGGFGKLKHFREMTPIDHQTVVRMNRDTLYSSGVFDLDAGPVTIALPDTGKRFMSLQVISQDHYTVEVVYAPGRHTYGKDKVGTRYAFFAIRTLANPNDAADIKAVHQLQDAIKAEQANVGKWEVPHWDEDSRTKVRDLLEALNQVGTTGSENMFGNKAEVDPVIHLLGTAVGWGGNPKYAAIYRSVTPKENDGKAAYRLSVKDVPVDSFWSISVYNGKGFFEKNNLDAYSVNNLTAKQNSDGGYTIQFGGDAKNATNYLPITPGWNYTVRLYRPRKELLDDTWKFPDAQPVK